VIDVVIHTTMQWKLMILIFAIICVVSFFIASKNSTENFEQEKKVIEEASDKGVEQYRAGSVAFDAYNTVHGKPPLSEALDHYRK
jgi:lipopolysaccharide export system protein LptC